MEQPPDLSIRRWKRPLLIPASFTDAPPLKRRPAHINTLDSIAQIGEATPCLIQKQANVLLDEQDAILGTCTTLVDQTHHLALQNEAEICSSPRSLMIDQGLYPVLEPCRPLIFDDFLKGCSQSIVQAVVASTMSIWSWKRTCDSEAETVNSPTDVSKPFEYPQHPAPWLVSTHWVPTLLMACAKSISEKDKEYTYHLLYVLKSLTSPKAASLDCRLGYYFTRSLECKLSGNGHVLQKEMWTVFAKVKIHAETALKIQLVWKEVTPWCAFGQDAANAAILEALKGANRLHVVDVSQWTSLCVQWPTLIEALATRPEGAPHLRLTVVMMRSKIGMRDAVNATSKRITRFAQMMGLPSFTFHVIYEPVLEKLEEHSLGLRLGEALAINLNQTLQFLPMRAQHGGESPRDVFLKMLHKCNPKVMVIVENEVDQVSPTFSERFSHFYRFVSLYLGSMDRPDMPANHARLQLLEAAVKRMIVNNVACDDDDNSEQRDDVEEFRHECCEAFVRREEMSGWAQRLKCAGFEPINLADDVLHCVKMLLRMYPSQWGLLHDDHHGDEVAEAHELSPTSITLTWCSCPVHTFSVWSPAGLQ